jgi:hypothetical protein
MGLKDIRTMRLVKWTGGYQNHEAGVEDWRISEP